MDMSSNKKYKTIQNMINKLITLLNDQIDDLSNLNIQHKIKSEKVITDLLAKLLKLSLEIEKTTSPKKNNLSEIDSQIIEAFYKKYKNQGEK